MSGYKLLGRLPDRPARLVLVSGEYPELTESLGRLGIETVVTAPDNRLPPPVQWHPDMQACVIGSGITVLNGSALLSSLERYGISAGETFSMPEPAYPKDVLCNFLSWGRWALGNSKTVDKTIVQAADSCGAAWINVRQGYAACATALVNEQSAVTADIGIAEKLEQHGMRVLRISSGGIALPGYQYGFIGGCCGKLAPDLMAFSGRLDSHPDGGLIRRFLSERGVRVIEVLNGRLLDVGGMIALL